MASDKCIQKVWFLLRLALGWTFLWAFLDKVFGLGFATKAEDAWLAGGSPTFGFLNFATKGPLVDVFKAMAGNPVVDWLFMLGLLFMGVTLTLGIANRLAGHIGVLLMAMMYIAGFIPPEHNPIVDEHIINLLLLLLIAKVDAGKWYGLSKWWNKTGLVKKFRFLK